jgi:predicted DCC family thiol-disulfide oxidoreductase YuxK
MFHSKGRRMATLPPGVNREDRIVLFDGECVLCNASARALIRADHNARFKLAALQSPQGRRLLAWFDLGDDVPQSIVLCEGDRLSLRSTAFVRVLWRLGAAYKVLAAAVWLIPRPLRDLGYDAIARNRYRLFGRKERCDLPTPADQLRLWNPAREDNTIERGLVTDECQEV